MTDKTDEQIEAEGQEFVDHFVATLPDILTTKQILQILGITITQFSKTDKDAAEVLALCALSVKSYYDNRTEQCDCPKCRAKRNLH